MSYVDEVYENVVAKNPSEPEFHQAVKEVLDSLRPVIDANEEEYRKEALLERIVEPERVIMFRVPWVDDQGQVHVNKGYPCTVQQCNRTLQRRSSFASISKPGYHQILRI